MTDLLCLHTSVFESDDKLIVSGENISDYDYFDIYVGKCRDCGRNVGRGSISDNWELLKDLIN